MKQDLESNNKQRQLYFPNLNCIRAIAAFMVIPFHIELVKREFGYRNIENLLVKGGDMGVILFFVLSGFLITFLLIKEQNDMGEISLKDFYIRRILRIWPLYFIVVLSCLFILPNIEFLYEPLYSDRYLSHGLLVFFYVFFLSNFLTGLHSHVNFARPTWSVSVEEQFYLLWPLLMKFSSNKKKVVIIVILVYWIVRIMLTIGVQIGEYYQLSFRNLLYALKLAIYYTPFDCLSIGAIAAIFLFEKKLVLKWIFDKRMQRVVFLSLPILIYIFSVRFYFNIHFLNFEISNEIYSLLFAIVILNLAGNPNCIISLEKFRLLKFLGKISYGLYLYHWIVIVLVMNVYRTYLLNYPNEILFNFFVYFLSIGLTILLSSASYFLVEIRFLKLKHKFSKIVSGDLSKGGDNSSF